MNATAPQPCCSGRLSGAPHRTNAVSFRSAVGSQAVFRAHRPAQQQRRCFLQINNALSRSNKEKTVEKLVSNLENSAIVFGVRFQNISVKEMTEFRRQLPASANILICKNTLMRIASDRVEGWSDLKQATTGDNAWIFVQEEGIADAVKAYDAFEKKLVAHLPREQRAAAQKTDISGGCMDGKFIDRASVLKLEKMPTKKELIAKIAMLLKALPTKVAVSIKQVPTKLAVGVKALADGDDNKDLVVGDVFPKAEAS